MSVPEVPGAVGATVVETDDAEVMEFVSFVRGQYLYSLFTSAITYAERNTNPGLLADYHPGDEARTLIKEFDRRQAQMEVAG